MSDTSPQYTITMHEGAYDVLLDCAVKATDTTIVNSATDYEELAAAYREVAELQANLLTQFVRLVRPNSYDGDVSLAVDGPLSLFFRRGKSGYHGAMIFHPSTKDSGRWSTHT